MRIPWIASSQVLLAMTDRIDSVIPWRFPYVPDAGDLIWTDFDSTMAEIG